MWHEKFEFVDYVSFLSTIKLKRIDLCKLLAIIYLFILAYRILYAFLFSSLILL